MPEDVGVPFVMARTDTPRGFGECRAMAIMDRGNSMVAAVIFHGWVPEYGIMQISAAADDPRWATREVMRAVMGYAFDIAGCQSVYAHTDPGNTRVRRLWKAMGAQEHIIPRLRGRTASDALLVLTHEAWASSRFARLRHEQTQSAQAA